MIIAAVFAKPLTRLMAFAGRGFSASATSPDTSGPVKAARAWPKPDGAPLQVRAHRIHNRDPKAAAIYLRKHLILSRGRFSE